MLPIAAATRLAGRWTGGRNDASRSQLKRHHPIVNNIPYHASRAEIPWTP